MREIIQSINKASLAEATGISYNRLRKFASGLVKELKNEEIKTIRQYFLELAEKFNY